MTTFGVAPSNCLSSSLMPTRIGIGAGRSFYLIFRVACVVAQFRDAVRDILEVRNAARAKAVGDRCACPRPGISSSPACQITFCLRPLGDSTEELNTGRCCVATDRSLYRTISHVWRGPFGVLGVGCCLISLRGPPHFSRCLSCMTCWSQLSSRPQRLSPIFFP